MVIELRKEILVWEIQYGREGFGDQQERIF